jgi:hypothetical protein
MPPDHAAHEKRRKIMPHNDVDQLLHSIAVETQTPRETVLKMYEATLREITDGAKVLDYIALLAEKRVRNDLRAKPH